MNFAQIWCITNPTPARRVTLPWNVYMAKFDPGWEGYPVWQSGLLASAGHPTYHVNVIKLKWDIIATGGLPPPPLKQVTSPTWGPPPPCKQALSVRCWGGVIRQLACKQAVLFGRASRERASEGLLSSAPRGCAARSRVLARLALLAKKGELARRLLGSLNNDDGHGNENVTQKVNSHYFKLHRSYSSHFIFSNVGHFFRSWILKECI